MQLGERRIDKIMRPEDTGYKQRVRDGDNRWKSKPEEKDDHVDVTFDEAVDFTRFMGRILQEEKRSGPAKVLADSPQRLRAARHQERPLGRIRMGAPR